MPARRIRRRHRQSWSGRYIRPSRRLRPRTIRRRDFQRPGALDSRVMRPGAARPHSGRIRSRFRPGRPPQYDILIRTVLGDTRAGAARRFTRLMNDANNIPRRSLLCVARKIRREVLFAKKRTGKGARSRKNIKPSSSVRCR